MSGPRPILFDTDVGSDVDDALALAYVLAEPDAFELTAVTTVGRNGAVRAKVAASLLGLAGRSDVETCIGAEAPLLRHTGHFNWFDHEADCVAEAPPAPVSDEPAAERIVRASHEHPGLELVAIGPMTNLARALALDPTLRDRVAGVTIMGGHVREARIGRLVAPRGLDYNLCSDPEASVAVLGAGWRTTLVTADVTLQTWLRDAHVDALREAGPLQRELARQVDIWKPKQHQFFTAAGGDLAADNAAFLHDPLTLLALVDESHLVFEDLHIVTSLARGVLYTAEVPADAGIGAPMRVATGVDAATASEAIAGRLLRA